MRLPAVSAAGLCVMPPIALILDAMTALDAHWAQA